MSVDGSYTVTINSPVGSREVTLTFAADGDSLSGRLSGQDGEEEFSGGSVDGSSLSWEMDVTRPMPLHLVCSATIDGDAISGNIELGAFGDASFSGSRT